MKLTTPSTRRAAPLVATSACASLRSSRAGQLPIFARYKISAPMTEAFDLLHAQLGQEATNSPSPFMRWLRPVILAVEAGSLTFRIRVREEMLNPGHSLHGGVSAAMIDDIIGATLFTLPDPVFYVSLHLSVDYLGPAFLGDEAIVRSTLVKKGRRHVLGVGEVWNTDESRVLVRGTAHLIPREAR